MDSNHQTLVDINLADEETLTQLHGVGSRLAKRIMAARPFENIEDLKRVRGISNRDVKRLRPFLTITSETLEPEEAQAESPAEVLVVLGDEPETPETGAALEDVVEESSDAETLEQLEEAESAPVETPNENAIASPETEGAVALEEVLEEFEETEEEPEPESIKDEIVLQPIPALETEETSEQPEAEPLPEDLKPAAAIPAAQPPIPTRFMTHGWAMGLVFFGSLFTLILAIAITLGILSSLNRGQLTYASPSQVMMLQTQLNGLAIQVETLSTDLNGMRTRLDNLEALSGRVNDLEAEIATLHSDMDTLQADLETTQAQYEELAGQLETIQTEIETLQTQNSRFEGFFQGLRDLLKGLFPEAQE